MHYHMMIHRLISFCFKETFYLNLYKAGKDDSNVFLLSLRVAVSKTHEVQRINLLRL